MTREKECNITRWDAYQSNKTQLMGFYERIYAEIINSQKSRVSGQRFILFIDTVRNSIQNLLPV